MQAKWTSKEQSLVTEHEETDPHRRNLKVTTISCIPSGHLKTTADPLCMLVRPSLAISLHQRVRESHKRTLRTGQHSRSSTAALRTQQKISVVTRQSNALVGVHGDPSSLCRRCTLGVSGAAAVPDTESCSEKVSSFPLSEKV